MLENRLSKSNQTKSEFESVIVVYGSRAIHFQSEFYCTAFPDHRLKHIDANEYRSTCLVANYVIPEPYRLILMIPRSVSKENYLSRDSFGQPIRQRGNADPSKGVPQNADQCFENEPITRGLAEH